MPEIPYDLLLAGGHVVDPASGYNGVADVAIRHGRIVAVSPNLRATRAAKEWDASGKMVCAGLIDAHTHVMDAMMPVSIDPDITGLPTGVTTLIDAGSAGARTFAGFRKHIISRAQTRILAFLNISSIGLVVTNELYLDPKMLNSRSALRVVRENRDLIVGIKARIKGEPDTLQHDVEVMKKAIDVATELELPIMMHWTNLTELLDLLRPGDCMTHPFSPTYYGPCCLDDKHRLLPHVRELSQRGIMVDLGHGSSFDWAVAEAAADQGWYPDVLSTDMFTRYFGPGGVVGNLGSVMSKFLLLGLSIEQVIGKVTAAPAKMLRLPDGLGSLAAGAIADVTVLEAREGQFELTDSPRLKQVRIGRQMLIAVATVKGGRLFELNA
ncbi:MAG: amidohydrolase/deacetylase family metallohydrolase [Burkholderiaceae bacterium]